MLSIVVNSSVVVTRTSTITPRTLSLLFRSTTIQQTIHNNHRYFYQHSSNTCNKLLFQRQQQNSSTIVKTQQQRKLTTTTSPTTPPPPVSSTTKAATTETAATSATATTEATTAKKTWWNSAELWGTAGAIVGWGMSGSAIYDAFQQGPEVISLPMTSVLIVYSTLFTRWAMIIQPQNLFLAACHATNVVAQSNQLRRGLEYKIENGQQDQVDDMMKKAGIGAAILFPSVVLGPMIRKFFSNPNIFGTFLASIAAADAGPFTVHFWAPMSKWMISGASFFELHRPTDKISLPQYTVLTLTGFFFTRYALLVIPTNYVLCSVNIALFGSSSWHLGRKINADYLHWGVEETPSTPTEV